MRGGKLLGIISIILIVIIAVTFYRGCTEGDDPHNTYDDDTVDVRPAPDHQPTIPARLI